MLSRIIINKLFNLYDYDLDLTNADGSSIKFITAPNGYGKTTILDFIYAVMTGNYNRLYEIPFTKFVLVFTNQQFEAHHEVMVEKTVRQLVQDEKSDEAEFEKTELLFSLKELKDGEETYIEQFTLSKSIDGIIAQEGTNDNIDMFFVSQTCHYIDDKRLLNVKTEIKDETLYLNERSMKDYADGMRRILADPEQRNLFAQRIEVFKNIIDRCEFANKHIEIDERFGFRFVSHDELETKILPDDLSSGEKHMIIQSYEILLKAQTGSLIMIDEPELSLHMMWQINYLKNLQDMMAERHFQCIVATHSPQIFNSLWSKSVDLFTISSHQD